METQVLEKLIEEVVLGDRAAFRKLYDEYKLKVYNTARNITKDEKAAEDILQEVFVTIYTKLYKLKKPAAFDVWLYKIVVNCCNNYFRKNKNSISSEDSVIENLAGEDKEIPNEILEKKESYEELKKCIDKLSDKLRICIVFYYFNDMSIKEIAEVLNCSEGTVKSRLFKAKKNLEKELVSMSNGEGRIYGYR